ncbi:hypothetical protein ACSYAD_19200 [Acaryochloris marina NIES-2412]|uniref:hypothetical protein n=1 Tax=Acaryochloris marina TaxID=155978 RepID=UPI00405A1194
MQPLQTLFHSLLLASFVGCLTTGIGQATEVIQSNLATNDPLTPDSALTFELDQLPTSSASQLTLFIGKTDVTALLEIEGNRVIYKPRLLPLPKGTSTVTLYLVTPETTRQTIAQFPLIISDSPLDTPTTSEHPDTSPIPLDLPFTDIPPALLPQPSKEESSVNAASQASLETVETTTLTEEKKPISNTALEIDETSDAQQSRVSSTSKEPTAETADTSTPESTGSSSESTDIPDAETSLASEEITEEQDISLKSRFNISTNSQLLESTSGDAQPSDRPVFIDTKLEAGFDLKAKKGIWELNATANFLGVTNQEEALRFDKLGNQAPAFDLSDYIIESTIGPVTLSLGDQCYGNHPLLIDNFCSRGVGLKAQISDRIDVSFATLRSTSIVGVGDITGLQDFGNTLTAATLGIDLVKNNAEGVRFELTYMDGTRKAEDNFNVGEVVDTEKSNGFGIRLKGSDNSGRLRFDTAFARSRFTNPNNDSQLLFDNVQSNDGSFGENNFGEDNSFNTDSDSLLSTVETELNQISPVAVESITKTAYSLEASYDLFQNLSLGKDKTFSLSINGRHERIADQFQSLGAAVSTGQQQTLIGLNGELAGATFQFEQSWQEDNLDNVATILKTKTRSTSFSLGLPFKSMFNTEKEWVPNLNYSYQRVHQFGANVPIPELSSFDPTEIPDQISTDHQLSAEWSSQDWSLSYTFSHSSQDNRQPSRELADFITTDHQLAFSLQPTSTLQLNVGYGLNRANSIEEGITRVTHGPTLGLTWQFLPNASLALNYNLTINRDSLNQSFTRSDALEAALNWQFQVGQSGTGNAFFRFSRQTNLNRDNQFGFSSNSKTTTITAGISFSF